MAEARLRKAFRYKGDDDEQDDDAVALDEQEQEELIEKLRKQDEDSNDDYLRFLMIIPSVSWIVFIGSLIRARYAAARLICILAITSLWATIYNLIFIPTNTTFLPFPSQAGGAGGNSHHGSTRREPPKFAELKARLNIKTSAELSPAQKYVPVLNGVLSLLIGLWGLTTRDGRGVIEGFWLICWIPAVEYAMIQLARKWIVEVNPADLERLKYEFRGA